MTMSTREEQVVRDFLAPLSTVEPVRRRPAGRAPEPGPQRHYLRYAAIAVAAALLVAVIAVIAHPRKAEKPAKHHVDAGIFAKTHGWITLGGQQIIALNPEDPKQTRVLSRSAGRPIAWSRDGSQLLVSGPRGFGVLHANGNWTRLDRGSASGGSFTPDGSHVIYADNGTIWSVPANGGKREPITRGLGVRPDRRPAFTRRRNHRLPAGLDDAAHHGHRTHGQRRQQPAAARFLPPCCHLDGISNWRHSGISDLFALGWLGDSSRVLVMRRPGNTRCAMFAVNTDGSDLRQWGPGVGAPPGSPVARRQPPRIHSPHPPSRRTAHHQRQRRYHRDDPVPAQRGPPVPSLAALGIRIPNSTARAELAGQPACHPRRGG